MWSSILVMPRYLSKASLKICISTACYVFTKYMYSHLFFPHLRTCRRTINLIGEFKSFFFVIFLCLGMDFKQLMNLASQNKDRAKKQVVIEKYK